LAQFDVYRNRNRRTQAEIPYLLDLQHSILDSLATRVVAPLVRAEAFGKPARILNPSFKIEGRRMIMSTAELAGIPARSLGDVVTNLASERAAIVAAIDLLWSGV
jgi:toxin CcdB